MSKQANSQPSRLQPVFMAPVAPFVRGPKPFTRKGEQLDYKTDKTIPDDTFTIKELFDRYRKGEPMPFGLERNASYGDDPSHSDLDMGKIRHLDLSEVNALSHKLSQRMLDLEARRKALEAQKEPATPTPTTPTDPAPKA